MDSPPTNTLEHARRDAGLSLSQLWIRYFALGGMRAALELDAVVNGALTTTANDHDVIVHAINERFLELGRGDPLPYSDGEPG